MNFQGSEKLFTKKETRRMLKVSRARYEQLIESGLLPKPFVITQGSRPVHSETQVRICEANLYRKAIEDLQPKGAPPLKLNEKLLARIAA